MAFVSRVASSTTRRALGAVARVAAPGAPSALRCIAPCVRHFAGKPDAAAVGSDGSHNDFAPQPKAAANPADPAVLRKQVDDLIKTHKVVLFMKGTPAQPMCGFSASVVKLLHYHGASIHGVDVLSNPSLRALMKDYSSWPTFPQLYVNGEFVGGRDIAVSLHESGELKKMLEAAGAVSQ